MNMLANFFDIRKNSSALFNGLEIAENQSLCNTWMNQYPTLFLTFKDVDGLTFESARDMLRAQIAQICNEHDYLLDSKAVSENDKQTFRQLADVVNGRPDDTMLKTSLVLLMRMMQVHYGKPVILLLDEYDVPMAKASTHGYYDQMLEIIRSFIDMKGNSISEKLEILMAGGYIRERIVEDMTYDYLHSSEENFWSILYLTGYLTRMREADLPKAEWDSLQDSEFALTIPNAEVREIFESTIQKWFSDYAQISNRKVLFDVVWSGDTEKLTKEMNKLLRQTISYHDYREDFYHAFLAGTFAGGGYMVESNKEHGEGRSDVVVKDMRGGRIAIFEAKYSKSLEKLKDACDTALRQINDRMYAKEYEDDYDDINCYGIAFYKKRCMVKKK